MPITPMMQQYLQMKEQNPGVLLFFRLGDFYELFFDDACLVSKELSLTLTGRDCGLSERAPMCGVPYHAVDTYVAKLIEKGYRVAICEQMEDPALAKGLVERAITRIISPGTLIESGMLDERKGNYIASVYRQKRSSAIAYCDVSTGEFLVLPVSDKQEIIENELDRIAPRELVVEEDSGLEKYAEKNGLIVNRIASSSFTFAAASKQLCSHFKALTVAELDLGNSKPCVSAAGALLTFLIQTQMNNLEHILNVRLYRSDKYMALDSTARRSLELTSSLSENGRRGTLLWLLDRCVTTMGSRLMKTWIEQPLIDLDMIKARQLAIAYLTQMPFVRSGIREALKPVRDVERLLSRIAYGSVNARDCLALLATLEAVGPVAQNIRNTDSSLLDEILMKLEPMEDVRSLLERAINPDCPLSVREGNIIREGYNAELDEYREISANGKGWLAKLEQQERSKTGIKTLKVGYNRVFGYYIEVSKSYMELVPKDYIRKQTLANGERYITEELEELERKILGADENSVDLEYRLFTEIRDVLEKNLERLSRIAEGLKEIDVLLSLSDIAAENDYVMPEFNDGERLEIIDGRHPVVEKGIGRENFVPNDTSLASDERVMVITGPNMAGKSTYMRQVALIVLMAHMGSFVPASSASIPLTDRIFTRIGASDNLYGGQSTFMVEMTELSNILKYATPKSLIILDEVGRGTSTFDGLSIAWAAVEYIVNPKKCGARTLFATHYHELSELEGQLEGVVNYRITAIEKGTEVIFLRKIEKGGTDHSYGVAVAALSGLPDSLVKRAKQIMARLEVRDEEDGSIGQTILDTKKNGGTMQLDMLNFKPMELIEEIRELDVMSMSPIDALNVLFRISEKARRI